MIRAAAHDPTDPFSLLTDGEPLDLLDRKQSFAGHTYLVPGLDFNSLALTPKDVVFATKTHPVEAVLDCSGKKARLVDPEKSWSTSHFETVAQVQAFIDEATATLDLYGIEFEPSASGTVAKLIEQHVPQMTKLKPRFRTIAKEAVFGGPIARCSGGGQNVVSIDLSAAYLHGLRLPLPMLNSYVPVGPWDSWDDLIHQEGFIRAIVDVPDHGWKSLGLLPVKTGHRTIFPVGRVVGTWPISLLRQATQFGATVVQVVEGATYTGYPYLAPLADLLEHLKGHSPLGKTLAKALYTRAWGILGSTGRYKGKVGDHSPNANLFLLHSPQLTFETTSKLQEDDLTHRCRPSYRPDWAAVIATYCSLKMQRICYDLRGKIVAVHVDSVAFDLDDVTQPVYDQALKIGFHHVEGPCPARWYGVGLAVHGKRILHKSMKDTPTPYDLEVYSQQHPEETPAQHWIYREHQTAEARPIHLSLLNEQLYGLAIGADGLRPSVWHNRWTSYGWQRDVVKLNLLGPQPREFSDLMQQLMDRLPAEPERAYTPAPPDPIVGCEPAPENYYPLLAASSITDGWEQFEHDILADIESMLAA
jgi:hypothetical protein